MFLPACRWPYWPLHWPLRARRVTSSIQRRADKWNQVAANLAREDVPWDKSCRSSSSYSSSNSAAVSPSGSTGRPCRSSSQRPRSISRHRWQQNGRASDFSVWNRSAQVGQIRIGIAANHNGNRCDYFDSFASDFFVSDLPFASDLPLAPDFESAVDSDDVLLSSAARFLYDSLR